MKQDTELVRHESDDEQVLTGLAVLLLAKTENKLCHTGITLSHHTQKISFPLELYRTSKRL
jgi:hypothetical protein